MTGPDSEPARGWGPGPGLLLLVAAVALVSASCAPAPSPLLPASDPARELANLGWWLLGIAGAVVLVITALVLIPLRNRGGDLAGTPVTDAGGPGAILTGAGIAAAILAGVFVFTTLTLEETASPGEEPAVTVEVVGHQWWWEIRYLGSDSSVVATTANEFHIPVGEPVRLIVSSADVIHSLWIPQLQGKIDMIPGRSNTFWLEADRPGRYRGQCGEYCGLQHAHMELYVVADSLPAYRRWLDNQARPARRPEQPLARRGRTAFMDRECATCHTIRGSPAEGTEGPDLTHVASRKTLAAGMFPNDRAHLTAWIVNAPGLKPGSAMPAMALEPQTLRAIVAYLRSLR